MNGKETMIEAINEMLERKGAIKMCKKSKKGRILDYMQRHPKKEILATDFMKLFNTMPLIWESANARLSELKRYWLVEVVWEHKGTKIFKKKSRNRLIFKITEDGLNYNFR